MIEARIQLKRDFGANWDTNNPVLAAGEMGVDLDLNQFKIGDGVTAWTDLPYQGGSSGGAVPGGGEGGGSNAVLVAASDSPDAVKARADYVCGASNAQVTINQALTDAGNRVGTSGSGTNAYRQSSVILADGLYRLGSPILIPNRGIALRGTSNLTILSAQSGFTNAGSGATPALIKLANTAAGRSAGLLTISTMTLMGGSATTGVSGVVLDLNGTAPDFGNGSLGEPATSPDANMCVENLYCRYVPYGVRILGDVSGSKLRVCRIRDVIIQDYGIAGISGTGGSDAMIHDCTVQSGQSNNAVGFESLGGNCVFNNCKSSYASASGKTGGVGFKFSSSRVIGTSIISQDNPIGIQLQGSDCTINGFKYDTQVNAQVAMDISGSRCSVYAADIAVRGSSVTLTRGIRFSSGAADHDINVGINPSKIDIPVSVGTGSNIQDVSYLPRGMYRIHVAGSSGYQMLTGASYNDGGNPPGGIDDPDPEVPGPGELGLVGATTLAKNSSTSADVTLPSGVANGDLLLMSVVYAPNFNGGEIGTPSGWTLVHTDPVTSSMETRLYSRVMSSGVTAPTFNVTSPQKLAVGVAALRGVKNSIVVAANVAGVNSTNKPAPALTAGFDFVSVGMFLERNSSPSTTITAPAEMTLHSAKFGTGGGATSVAVASDMAPVTGGSASFGSWTTDVSNSSWVTYSIAVEIDS